MSLLLFVQEEVRKISLRVCGTVGSARVFTAMARTVGLPMAIAAKLLLSGMQYNSVNNAHLKSVHKGT